MQAFAFNIRRPLFQDIRVRQAGLMFDFEWANQQLFYGAYTDPPVISAFQPGGQRFATGEGVGLADPLA
jgi:ABC-type oligopeptide transport system substrate-binding subunit